jgi:two-component sensor histidine kinase
MTWTQRFRPSKAFPDRSGANLRNDPDVDLESADERTIRLLNEEVALLRRRAAHSDKSIRRVEALADAAAARFAQRTTLASKEIALLRKRVSHAHKRERTLKAVAKASNARSAERGAMLHEVNHRAKNSIQIAILLLNLQRHASDDPEVRLSLASAVERLSHIARVHSMLYGHTPDQQLIDFGEYLKTFCGELREALAGDIEVVCQGSDELALDSRRAVNLALITSEGVTNALKHAFPEGRAGTVSVSCSRHGAEDARLTVHDDGIGMGNGTGEETIGLKLIQTLVKGIDGTLSINSAEGTLIEVTFPL